MDTLMTATIHVLDIHALWHFLKDTCRVTKFNKVNVL